VLIGSPFSLRDKPGVQDMWASASAKLTDPLDPGFHQSPHPHRGGDRDGVLPRSDQETLARAIAGSRLVVYPGGGHAFYWEEPRRLASDLVAFVEGLDDRV
jgi:pimeloyl-ACP methyl ester carboxylesterase